MDPVTGIIFNDEQGKFDLQDLEVYLGTYCLCLPPTYR